MAKCIYFINNFVHLYGERIRVPTSMDDNLYWHQAFVTLKFDARVRITDLCSQCRQHIIAEDDSVC